MNPHLRKWLICSLLFLIEPSFAFFSDNFYVSSHFSLSDIITDFHAQSSSQYVHSNDNASLNSYDSFVKHTSNHPYSGCLFTAEWRTTYLTHYAFETFYSLEYLPIKEKFQVCNTSSTIESHLWSTIGTRMGYLLQENIFAYILLSISIVNIQSEILHLTDHASDHSHQVLLAFTPGVGCSIPICKLFSVNIQASYSRFPEFHHLKIQTDPDHHDIQWTQKNHIQIRRAVASIGLRYQLK